MITDLLPVDGAPMAACGYWGEGSQMIRRTVFVFVALISNICGADSPDRLTIELCGSGKSKLTKVEHSQLIQEDDYQYFFDKKIGVKYGETVSGSPFVGLGEQYFFVKDVEFSGLNGAGTNRFYDDQLPMRLADFYRFRNKAMTMVCLVSQFGGLGQSGRFQNVRWAVVFPANAKSLDEIKGFFGN